MRTFVVYRTQAQSLKNDVERHNYNDSGEPQFEGVVFSDGRVAQRWLTVARSVAIWDSFEDLKTVHIYAHPDYGTRIVWDNGDDWEDL